MDYKGFQQEILGFIGESGITSKVFFDFDEDKNRFESRIPEQGLFITGRPAGLSLTVRFGSGHQAMIPISAA